MRSPEPAPLLAEPPSTPVVPEYVLALEKAASYLPSDQLGLLRRAWAVGAAAHVGQTRKSGEPYITHPVAVATVLAEERLDVETLIAAILHDTIEDTPLTRLAIAKEFGETVADLVDGVTKLDKLQFRDRQEAAAESFRKMLLAMARDLRVILIKLADRLHNMRTLGAQSVEARRRIATETLEIYAPIAQRLGMNLIKAELQDLGFRGLHPWRHAVIEKRIRMQPVVRRESLTQIEARLAQRLTKEGFSYRLVGRIKSPWSIYSKMRAEGKTLDQVMDVFGFRIVVRTVPECYHALGVVHTAFKPLDGRFRDFVAIPKANGYQSLAHGVVRALRLADRSADPHRGNGPDRRARHRGALVVQARRRDADECAEPRAPVDRQPGRIAALDRFVAGVPRERQGRPVPRRGLPVHAEGRDPLAAAQRDRARLRVRRAHRCRQQGRRRARGSRAGAAAHQAGERADGGDHHGQVVDAQAAVAGVRRLRQGAHRDPPQLKHLEHEDAVQLGHRMLDRTLETLGTSLDRLPQQHLETYLHEHRYPRLEALLADIALGNRMPSQVANVLARRAPDVADNNMLLDAAGLFRPSTDRILITGQERGVITFANCCLPIPGDEIMGYHTAGRGIVVHRIECPNVVELRKSPERWVPVGWDREVTGDYQAALKIEVDNRPGVLAQVAAAIAQAESNIDRVEYVERDSNISAIRFSIEVHDRKHLADVIRRVRRLHVVHGVQRL
jgi:guanosine-3',5'-bis(diphosphate) 3'-pyrophosphohydrolase